MQKITPHLWFDKQAVEAMEFYVSVFPNSKINFKNQIKDTPSGDCDVVGFELMGHTFMGISGGPLFKFNPSISFTVACDSVAEVDTFTAKLSVGGKFLMPLAEYPFAKKYAWFEDKYGLTWQVIFMPEHKFRQKISPAMLFTQSMYGKAEEALNFYAKIFSKKGDSHVDGIFRYTTEQKTEKEGNIAHAFFTLLGQEFAAAESAGPHKFTFNEAISFMINCKDQAEIDYFWAKLSAVPESEQCGWLKDKYGVSWQVIPENMGQLLSKKPEKTTSAMLAMKKIIIADLEKAGI